MQPHFGIYMDGVEHDITDLVKEINVTHEDLDAEGSGRDVETGEMIRNKIGDAHTIDIKFRRLSASEAAQIHLLVQNDGSGFYKIRYVNPCNATGTLFQEDVYTPSINMGAQRYNKYTNEIYYDGVSMKAIRRYAQAPYSR